MYEPLIAALRNVDEYDSGYAKLMYDAADAIEELQKKYDGAVSDNKSLCRQIAELAKERNEAYSKGLLEGGIAQRAEDEKWMPKWIPVTERLPEDGKFVLVCNDDGHMMIAKHETETYEWYYKYTNYDFDIWDNEEQGPVRYWMPLPEPPKEEA